ncbi:MAG: glycosyltransferase family 4 protein [Armatimonadia bacterium]
MKVLTLTHELPPIGGGGGRIALELARRMAGLGHEIEIVTAACGDLPLDEVLDGVRIRRLPCGRKHLEYSTGTEKARYIAAAVKALQRQALDYDLIHAHFILPAGLVAALRPLPYLVTCHGSDVPGHNPYEGAWEHRLMRSLWRRVVDRAGAIVSPSQNLCDLLLRVDPSLDAKLHRIPNGYPCGKFAESTHEGGILMLSRLIPLKGFQWFLQGLQGLDLGVDVSLVGDGPMRAELEALANETPTKVIFHGWLDNDSPRLRELFESASIFVFPSEAENFPTVLLEAMDAGLAIVTTNVKGCPEVIGPAGLTVPPRSPEALRDAVQGLIGDPERRLSLGRQAHARVRAEFDWSVVERQYEALYGAVANATT